MVLNILIKCAPLLVEKAAVALDVALRVTVWQQVRVQMENYPGFITHWEGHTKSKIGGNQWPQKWTLIQKDIF